MPTYQYACTECGHAFEQFQSFSEDALTVCPECNGKLRKLFNAVGVVFKGSGFYRTDSREKPAASTSESSGGTGDTKKAVGTDRKTSGDSTKSSPNGSSPSSSGSPTAKSGSSSSSGSSSASGSAA